MTHPRISRLLRIRLHTVFLAIAVLSALLALHTTNMKYAERQEKAVAWVWAAGGRPYYGYELDEKGNKLEHWEDRDFVPSPPPPYPEWLLEMVGLDYFATVEHVIFTYKADLTDVAPLTGFPNLKSINITGCPVRDLSPLAGLKELDFVCVWSPAVTEEEAAKLRRALPDCSVCIYEHE